MKKLSSWLLTLSLVLSPIWASANWKDYIKGTLLENVQTRVFFAQEETQIQLVDTVIQIGKYKGSSILDLELGLGNETNPNNREEELNFLYGATLRVDPYLRPVLNLPEHWEFLRSLRHGVAVFYDEESKDVEFGYTFGLAFDLNPTP